jgi:sensor histidine kinase YesM
LAKQGGFLQKLFGVAITLGLSIGVSLSGAGLASLFINASINDTLVYKNDARLLTIITIQTLQIVLFYVLARKHYHIRDMKRKPTVVLSLGVLLVFFCLFFMLDNLSYNDERTNNIFIFLAVGMLFILIGAFLLYEVFVRENENSVALSMQVQRLEMESQYYRELNAVQADLRTWRHEYNNNLTALRALIESNSLERALAYIDKIGSNTCRDVALLQTGNPVLDAVVSSKLLYARSQDIEVSIHAMYPKNNIFKDNDLCAICGNLLDNSIEACERMGESDQPRFISFSLLTKGKNLTISIVNSYEGEVKRDGENYLTTKDERYHGIGMKFVGSITDKYQGHMLSEYNDGVFRTHIMLPLVSVSEENK